MELFAQWRWDFRWERRERWKQCNIAMQRHGEWRMKMKVVSKPLALGDSSWGFSQGITWIPVSLWMSAFTMRKLERFKVLHHENPKRIRHVLASQRGPQRQTWLQLFQ
jgi:hypothetical protein